MIHQQPTQYKPIHAPQGPHPESKAARMALLRTAVKKVPFTLQEVRKDVPEVLPEVVRRQFRRLEGEGLITRLSKGNYVATCVLHLIDKKPEDPNQKVGIERMSKDAALAYLTTPRMLEDVQKKFNLGKDSARARLFEFIDEGCLHKMSVCRKVLYATTKAALDDAAAKHHATTREGRKERRQATAPVSTAARAPLPVNPVRLAIMEVADRKKPFSYSDVREHLPGVTKDILHHQAKRLLDEGVIARVDRGVYVAVSVDEVSPQAM